MTQNQQKSNPAFSGSASSAPKSTEHLFNTHILQPARPTASNNDQLQFINSKKN
jgi:hypothetical protein